MAYDTREDGSWSVLLVAAGIACLAFWIGIGVWWFS